MKVRFQIFKAPFLLCRMAGASLQGKAKPIPTGLRRRSQFNGITEESAARGRAGKDKVNSTGHFVGWLAPAYRDRRSQFQRDRCVTIVTKDNVFFSPSTQTGIPTTISMTNPPHPHVCRKWLSNCHNRHNSIESMTNTIIDVTPSV